jgi:hypothetical protein
MTDTRASRSAPTDALRSRYRPVLVLLTAFLIVSCAMEAVLAVQSASGTAVATAIWVRCSLVLGSSVVLLLIGTRAARGSRAAWIRLRIITVVVVVAVIVIVSIPRFLPDWVRIEQGVCGALVLPAAVILNLPRTAAMHPAVARAQRA